MSKPLVIAVVGPTAVGKSGVALELAESLDAEIVSADSRQVYRGMDIGTAKPSEEDRRRVPHHLIDIADPDERFSSGRYRIAAAGVITALHRNGKLPLVVGGTGLYLRALFGGLWEGPAADWELRERLREEERIYGTGRLHEELRRVDPVSAERIEPADVSKIIRAIEVFRKTGVPLSVFHDRHRFREQPYRAVVIGLMRQRGDLYARINARVDRMMEAGLEREVERLLAAGFSTELPAMKGVGYRQMAGYLEGWYEREEAVRLIQRDSRRYAKRQLTWFRHEASVRWIDVGPSEPCVRTAAKIRAAVEWRKEKVHA